MVSLTLQVNGADGAIRDLAAAAVRVNRGGPAFKVIAVRLWRDTQDNFRQGGRWPSKWAPLKHRTGVILVKTAVLKNSISSASDANSASVGTDVKYAAVHQLGRGPFTVTAKRGKALAFSIGGNLLFRRSVHIPGIPARPFLPVDASGNLRPDTETFIVRTLQNWIARGEASP